MSEVDKLIEAFKAHFEASVKELCADLEHHKKWHEHYASQVFDLRQKLAKVNQERDEARAQVDGTLIDSLCAKNEAYHARIIQLERENAFIKRTANHKDRMIMKAGERIEALEGVLKKQEDLLTAFATVRNFLSQGVSCSQDERSVDES